jgi:hypothetical protein
MYDQYVGTCCTSASNQAPRVWLAALVTLLGPYSSCLAAERAGGGWPKTLVATPQLLRHISSHVPWLTLFCQNTHRSGIVTESGRARTLELNTLR